MRIVVLTMLFLSFIVIMSSIIIYKLAEPKAKKKGKSISEMKSPLSVSGRVWARKNCMFGEIISKGGIEVLIYLIALLRLRT
jgi:hypothetical protein